MDDELVRLIRLAAEGDADAWKKLVEDNRPRIRRMLDLRLDPRLRARVDASDILQEAFVEAFHRLDRYLEEQPASFFLWLRFLAGQQLLQAHRKHLGTRKRDASMEIHRLWGGCPNASSPSIIQNLLGKANTPSRLAVKMEEEERLRQAIDTLPAETRELLALRHFEHLSNLEAAQVMGMNPSTTSTRYLAALRQLKSILPDLADD